MQNICCIYFIEREISAQPGEFRENGTFGCIVFLLQTGRGLSPFQAVSRNVNLHQ